MPPLGTNAAYGWYNLLRSEMGWIPRGTLTSRDAVGMALATREIVDGKASFSGRTLAEWVPEAVDLLVEALDPLSVILFGSVARGDDGPDSDIDLLVIVDDDRDRRKAAVTGLRVVASLPPEVDPIVIPQSSAVAHRDVAGTLIRPALREGKVVYSRAR